MKEIKLSQEKVAFVDDEDFESINSFRWYAAKSRNTFYAVRKVMVGGKRTNLRMHWEIMKGKSLDHIDGNGLNNQKSNLRFCTASENGMNMRRRENTTSTYKGVSFYKPHGNWRARIMFNRKDINLGYFSSEIDAAKAYNTKAIELFCEFANLNNI